jgi:hypothetical protein
MSKPSVLDLALQNPPILQSPLSPGFFSDLSERVEAALASSRRETLTEMSEALKRIVDTKLQAAPEALRTALVSRGEAADVAEAAELGRLAFALQLLTQALHKRVPDGAVELARSEPYTRYVEALGRGERTNAELRDEVGEVTETVSRKLRVLRDHGLTEFRKEGRRMVNFLTPSGWACVEPADEAPAMATPPAQAQTQAQAEAEADDSVEVSRTIAISSLRRSLPPQFSEQPIIQGSDPEQKLYRHG